MRIHESVQPISISMFTFLLISYETELLFCLMWSGAVAFCGSWSYLSLLLSWALHTFCTVWVVCFNSLVMVERNLHCWEIRWPHKFIPYTAPRNIFLRVTIFSEVKGFSVWSLSTVLHNFQDFSCVIVFMTLCLSAHGEGSKWDLTHDGIFTDKSDYWSQPCSGTAGCWQRLCGDWGQIQLERSIVKWRLIRTNNHYWANMKYFPMIFVYDEIRSHSVFML